MYWYLHISVSHHFPHGFGSETAHPRALLFVDDCDYRFQTSGNVLGLLVRCICCVFKGRTKTRKIVFVFTTQAKTALPGFATS